MKIERLFFGLLPLFASISLVACSQTAPPQGGSTTTPASEPSAATADACKDFPAQELRYPSVKSCSFSKGDGVPTRYTMSVETADPIDKVTKWYQTEPKTNGWNVKESDPSAMTAKHTVVSIDNGKGYATISLFDQDGGTSFQINIYPNGNEG